jgi:hypothetical protein
VDCYDIWVEKCGATYQRAMSYIFHELIGKIVEIYIDDVVNKFLDHESHLNDVRKTLECTQKHGLKMNPNKCVFGVSAGEYLGFLVHEGVIEVGKKRMKLLMKLFLQPISKNCNHCRARSIL